MHRSGDPLCRPGNRSECLVALSDRKIFTILFADRTTHIAVHDRASVERRTLIEGVMGARYVPSGHLVYSQGDQLVAVPFDADRLEVTGAPVPLVDGVQPDQFAVSRDGALVYGDTAVASLAPDVRVTRVSRDGSTRPLLAESRVLVEPRLSPDGRRLAFTAVDDQSIDIWVYELERETMTRLSFEQSNDSIPAWSPDGTPLMFSSDRSGGWNIFTVPSHGSGEARQLTTSDHPTTGTS